MPDTTDSHIKKRAACENCRARKVKCCGEDPCRACSRQRLKCIYAHATERNRTHASRIAKIRHRENLEDIDAPSRSNELSGTDGNERNAMSQNLSDSQQFTPDGRRPAWESNFPLATHGETGPGSSAEVPRSRAFQHNATPIGSVATAWTASPLSPQSAGPSPFDTLSLNQNATTIQVAAPDASSNCVSFPYQGQQSPGQVNSSTQPFNSQLFSQTDQRAPNVGNSNAWPHNIEDATLLPWIVSYFKRLHPIAPVLSHISIYEAMLLGRHRTDRDFGAMILALCSIAMIQPIFTQEAPQLTERISTARMLMQHSARMRSTWDFGENPTVETVLTSFFLFGCLFSDGQQRAAWHQLRLAVDMSCQMGLDQPDLYPMMRSKEERDQKIRIYLALAVTERACALMRGQSIGLRGNPWSISLFAQNMSILYDDPDFGFANGESAGEISGLLCLAHLFDSIDENIINCWNGRCKKTDGICDATDRRQILAVSRRVTTAASSLSSSNMLAAPVLSDSQRTDILITQLWIMNRIWHLSMSHDLLQSRSEHSALTPEFAIALAGAASIYCRQTNAQSIEVHGMGMIEKISDLNSSMLTARDLIGDERVGIFLQSESFILNALSSCLDLWKKIGLDISRPPTTTDEIASTLNGILREIRHGQHPYMPQIPADDALG